MLPLHHRLYPERPLGVSTHSRIRTCTSRFWRPELYQLSYMRVIPPLARALAASSSRVLGTGEGLRPTFTSVNPNQNGHVSVLTGGATVSMW